MSDEELRKREREAAVGGPEEQARLEAAEARSETPEEALDRLLTEVRAGLATVSEPIYNATRDTHTFANGVEVIVTHKRFSQGETSEHEVTLAFDGSSLTCRQYDSDHVSEESLEFDRAPVYSFRLTAADMNANPRRSGDRAAARWANRLLRALGLPPGRRPFEGLIGKVLRTTGGFVFGHVFQGVPDNLAP